MEKKVFKYIQENHMISPGEGIVVGVSGGADSMCLLALLRKYASENDVKLLVVHVNHGIRGAAAKRDEDFVREYCEAAGIECEWVHVDALGVARDMGLSVEEAGRKLRYNAFREACLHRGFKTVAIAHNSDDNAETVLFNILRGSGMSGVRGITPVRKDTEGIRIIRPLLSVTRAEIEEYLNVEGIGHIEDETNASGDYSRNRIRNEILPAVARDINAGAKEHLVSLSVQAAEIEDYINSKTLEAVEGMEQRGEAEFCECRAAFMIPALKEQHPAIVKSIIRKAFQRLSGSLKDIESIHVNSVFELIDKGTGKQLSLPYGITAVRDYERLILERRTNPSEAGVFEGSEEIEISLTIPKEGEKTAVSLPGGGQELVLEIFNQKNQVPGNKSNCFIWLDYDIIKDNLIVRHRRMGDYLLINGIDENGVRTLVKKPLKRYFIDRKISSEERDKAWLLACGDHILWVVGDRRDDSFRVTTDTERILAIRFQ